MVSRVLPYLPSPRPAAPELGRRATSPPWNRIVGLIEHLAGVLLFVAVPMLFAATAVYFLLADWSIWWRASGFIVFMTIAIVYSKSLLPRRKLIPPAVIPVAPGDQPTPYAFLARVAEEIGAPAPRRLWIGSGTELALGGRRSLLDLIRIGRWEMQIGLWLWHGLTLSEFQAIVARTLAPLARGRLEHSRHAAREILDTMISGNDFLDEMADNDQAFSGLARMARGAHAIAVFPLRALGRVLLHIGTIASDPLDDDLSAVRVTGSDAVVHAILRSDFAGATLRKIDRLLDDASRVGIFTNDLYAHVSDATTALREEHNDFTLGETPTLRSPNAGKYADVFEPDQAYLSKVWNDFPAAAIREQNAKRTFVACERDERSATELLDDPQRLREKLSWLRYTEVFDCDDDFAAVDVNTVSNWIRHGGHPQLPSRLESVFDGNRPIDPGDPHELDTAMASELWTDGRLVSMAAGMYARAGEKAGQWRAAQAALDKVLRRTVYRPNGRERALAEDLEDDLRKAGRWLCAMDRWAYVIHVHMAARLPELSLHDALLQRYESVARIAPLAADAREYRNRVASFVRKLDEFDGLSPYRMQRDAAKEFRASRKDLVLLLKESTAIKDPLLSQFTGDVSLDKFLFAHDTSALRTRLPVSACGRRLLFAWNEITTKAQWLYGLNLAALLELHERIEEQFRAQVGPITITDESIPEAIVQDKKDTVVEIDVEPDVIELEIDTGTEKR